ncbi:MAG: hypothetical protein PHW95_04270 [Patescibacteria group bacterium]|nr:hypothetical protein [Patescibacteria group bacterium]
MTRFLRSIKYSKIEITLLLIMIYEFGFPHYALAIEPSTSVILPNLVIKSANASPVQPVTASAALVTLSPITRSYTVKKTHNIPITAYSSTIDQTDSTPCNTANGFNLCEHNQEDVIAANFLPFGTKVRIPEYFGDRVFTVQDRMNARYSYHADVWMKTRAAAVVFGLRYTKLEVLE